MDFIILFVSTLFTGQVAARPAPLYLTVLCCDPGRPCPVLQHKIPKFVLQYLLDKRDLDHNMTQFDTKEQATLQLALCVVFPSFNKCRVLTASYKSYNLAHCPIFVLYLGEEGICPIIFLKMSYKSYKNLI